MKVKLKSLGSKQAEETMVAKAPEKWYPSTTVDGKDFPGLKGCALGKDHHVKMKIRKVGEHMHKGSDGKTAHRIDVELRGMEDKKKEHGYKNINQASFGARKEM